MPSMVIADETSDPWESVNRPIASFNDTVDKYTLRPLAKGYDYVTPAVVDDGITNFFKNIGELNNLGNNVLQGKLHNAGVDTARLLINSTVGLLGVFDVASHAGLVRNEEDFGQTLAVWGVSSGPYVVVPLLGPSTPRDLAGRLPDATRIAIGNVDHVPTRNSITATNIIDTRAGLLESEKLITGDRYTFIRNAYLQRRDFLINDGVVEDDF
ncbi:VacJ family lipoprotein [Pseudomonas sp. A3.4]|nr:VacJ family lipoprotein [Atopomonas sediminilitoris]MCJ8170791.1 VacJ family lipoprotein [Atopomonas sediminilitoris]